MDHKQNISKVAGLVTSPWTELRNDYDAFLNVFTLLLLILFVSSAMESSWRCANSSDRWKCIVCICLHLSNVFFNPTRDGPFVTFSALNLFICSCTSDLNGLNEVNRNCRSEWISETAFMIGSDYRWTTLSFCLFTVNISNS